MSRSLLAPALILFAACTPRAREGTAPRPLPGGPHPASAGVPVMPAYARAISNGTRARNGAPGPRYWQQWASYDLTAVLDDRRERVSGTGQVRYHNRSPDSLSQLAVHLYQNIHRPGVRTNERVEKSGGLDLRAVSADGDTLRSLEPGDSLRSGYRVDGTVAWLRLRQPLAPGDSIDLGFAWSFRVPRIAPRMGTDGDVFFVGYWYPQLAVYDDVNGWQTDPYLGNGEFYMGYATYRVALDVPAGWLVGATGELNNAADVLAPETRERLARSRLTDSPVRVVEWAGRGAGRATTAGERGRLVWRFSADSVRDFAWVASDEYVWDATHAVVGDRNGDGRADTAMVHALYRPASAGWGRAAQFGRHALAFHSGVVVPYPWSHMTVAEGIVSGGMEYPMLTILGGLPDAAVVQTITAHEIGHMWFPMLVGSDEKRFAWQDEGLTSFLENLAVKDFRPPGAADPGRESQSSYVALARRGGETALMQHADRYPQGPSYSIASYDKPAAILRALGGVVGDTVVRDALREYARRWRFRHPLPQDFWSTVEEKSGRDLGWFWRTWFYETYRLDQAVESAAADGDSLAIVIENRGTAPMPVRLAVTRRDGTVERVDRGVEPWLRGDRRVTVRVARPRDVRRVELDPERLFPDVNHDNGIWTP